MSLEKLPNGRWRARIYHDGGYKSVPLVLGQPQGITYRTKREAAEAKEKARLRLRGGASEMTLRQFWELWTTAPRFARPKESTNIHNRERTKAFVERYGDMKIAHIGDAVVGPWLDEHVSTVPALRAMFNDAMSAKGGRVVEANPFAALGLAKTKGNKLRQPPTQEQMEGMLRAARRLTPPSFAAYLEFACFTGARPSELDALLWERVRFADGEVDLFEQYNAKTRKFGAPKYGPYTAALTARARDVLLRLPRETDFVFTTLRGSHYTPSARSHHWNRVRCAAGLEDMTLYLATRHYFGSMALNVLDLQPHIIAEQLGHKDGGKLVVELYGHPNQAKARREIRDAFDQAAKITPLKIVRDESA